MGVDNKNTPPSGPDSQYDPVKEGTLPMYGFNTKYIPSSGSQPHNFYPSGSQSDQSNECDCTLKDCGEADCSCDYENLPSCICVDGTTPDSNLKCINSDMNPPFKDNLEVPGFVHSPNSGTSDTVCDTDVCENHKCGEATCICLPGKESSLPTCMCLDDMSFPDENLKCKHPIDSGSSSNEKSVNIHGIHIDIPNGAKLNNSAIDTNEKNEENTNTLGNPEILFRECDTKKVCKDLICGEAGCYCDLNGKAACLCVDGTVPSPKLKKCSRNVQKPIDAQNYTMKPIGLDNVAGNVFRGNLPTNPTGKNLKHPTTEQTALEQNLKIENHFKTIKIAIPASLISFCFLMLIALLIWKRRTRSNKRKRTSQAISWIHKQDQVHLLENMTVIGKNPYYLGSDVISAQLKGIQTTYIPRSSLKIMSVIGEGAFGKVFKGEVCWTENNTSLVAVKILKEDASNETREDFTREVKIVSSFSHENILKLVGVVAKEKECPYMVFEFMEHGDLTELLRSNEPSSPKQAAIELKQIDLVDVATQIANGMMYLASKHFVHRDLATRNCLVGADLVVKISDFGMSRDIYTCDYYKIGGARMLPVRWMSPESIKYGRFTAESDVWSYGVVLWEVFSFGKQPYYGHTNEEVIRFIDDGILLQRPKKCPDTVYHVMLGCWRKNCKDRFTFERIYNHLRDYNKKMVKCYHQHNIQGDVALTIVEES